MNRSHPFAICNDIIISERQYVSLGMGNTRIQGEGLPLPFFEQITDIQPSALASSPQQPIWCHRVELLSTTTISHGDSAVQVLLLCHRMEDRF